MWDHRGGVKMFGKKCKKEKKRKLSSFNLAVSVKQINTINGKNKQKI